MMKEENNYAKFAILFVPWLLANLFQGAPVASFFIAWIGSFFIFYMTLTGKIKPIPNDRPIAEQLMRPVFIVQLIFAGYMACTSVFYFLSVLGYEYLSKTNFILAIDQDAVNLTAKCQRYYCLGHASFAAGILYFMRNPKRSPYFVEKEVLANLLLRIALISYPVSILFTKLPGLNQFYFQLSSLSFISGTLALAFAIPLNKVMNTLICLALYLFNFYSAFTSGFKEPIIISVMVLGLFLYPSYKRLVTIIFLPAMLLLFMFLPAYVGSFRQQAWSGDETAQDASQNALDAALSQDEDSSNWGFLTGRLSEIEMFTKYVRSTPDNVGYYHFDILKQSLIAVVPRVLWPSKPITEDLVMQRVYSAGVVSPYSNVSAKPPYVVDAYLSWGSIGIFVFLFAYGAAAQLISMKAEMLFGGYILGTALVFSGLFQIFWRGLSFEFLINSVFWSYVTMWILFKILRSRNILQQH